LTEYKDFVDTIQPILEAGSWTNYGSTPKIIGKNIKSARGNKNARIEVKNEEGGHIETSFDGSVIYRTLRGSVIPVSTKGSDRDKMKVDIMAIMKVAGYPYTAPTVSDIPKIRNKQQSSFLFEIIVT
jgi:hypothetical protein